MDNRIGYYEESGWVGLQKTDRAFVDREHDAPVFTDNSVLSTGRIDHECSRVCRAVRVPLGTSENDDMLVAGVLVERNDSAGGEAKEGGTGAFHSIAIEPVNIHARTEGLSRHFVWPLRSWKICLSSRCAMLAMRRRRSSLIAISLATSAACPNRRRRV